MNTQPFFARAQLNPNRWDSTDSRWMKLDIVTQWVTAHSEKLCTSLAGLALALRRMDRTVSLLAELALATEQLIRRSPT